MVCYALMYDCRDIDVRKSIKIVENAEGREFDW